MQKIFCKFSEFFCEIFSYRKKLFLKEEFYETWRTDGILIKKRSWSLQLFHRTDVLRESICFWKRFHKKQYCTYKKFFIYGRKKSKSWKYSSEGILVLVKLQVKVLPLEMNSLRDILKYLTKVFCFTAIFLNLKCIEWFPRIFVFCDHFNSKNARKLNFHELLYFYARKHVWQFYLKSTEFTRNCEFCSNLDWGP